MKTCPSVTFYFLKNSFSDMSRKWILPSMIRAGTALIVLGEIHFLLISENESKSYLFGVLGCSQVTTFIIIRK